MAQNHKIWLTVYLSLLLVPAFGQDYAAVSIADSLKENAHAVIREYTREFELQTVSKGTEKVRKVITILDPNGDDYAQLRISYDKDTKVNIRQMTLYDRNGNRLKKISQSDISDLPAYDGASLYSDHRVKVFTPGYGEYPFTFEYEYEINYTNLISYGKWYPLYGYNLSLEHSLFTFIHPSEIEFNKKEIGLGAKSTIKNLGSKVSETWVCGPIKAFEYEAFDINLSERVPRMYLMPLRLSYDSYSGNARNWNEYGKWINDLYSGRDEISEPEKLKLAKLLENTSDTIQKIKLLYEYMQGHTRYVGIQLGIGGLQPFPATTVSETGYGDCKALTNFMHSMLKQFGIISWPALVSSGEYIEPIYPDFPNFQQFDHVILCIPGRKDTIWLECTSQSIPFGFLGDFTDDRDVLLITQDGGKMAHTRRYNINDNLRISKAEFTIDPKGDANCRIKTQYKGLQYYNISAVLNVNADEQKKWIYRNSSLPSQKLIDFNIKNKKDIIPLAEINDSLTSNSYCSFAGNYMLLPLNRINVQPPVKKLMKSKHSDFIIHRSTADYDTAIYKIPENYKIESLPAGKAIRSDFGDYSFSASIRDNKIIYSRKFIVNQGRFKASEYKSFYDFFLAVSKADNEKVMLVK